MLISSDSSQDPSSYVLHTLQFVKFSFRNSSKKCIAVVNVGKNKGNSKPFSDREGSHRAGSSNISEMKKKNSS